MNTASLDHRSNIQRSGTHGPILLFGHGLCTDSAVFQHQVNALSRDHQEITYDLAGFGRSDAALFDPTRHHRLEGYAKDLVGLLDELDQQDVTLVGAPGARARLGLRRRQPPVLERRRVRGGLQPGGRGRVLRPHRHL